MAARAGGDRVEHHRVALDLLGVERADPVVAVARLGRIDLIGPDDREPRERRVIGQIGRLEQPRAVDHRAPRIDGLAGGPAG